MFWRAHTQEHGAHVHVRLFVAETKERTFAGVGQLTMGRPEWEDLRKRLDLEVTDRQRTEPEDHFEYQGWPMVAIPRVR